MVSTDTSVSKMAVLWAKMYYAFAKELLDTMGEVQGKQMLVKCIEKYAAMRGEAVAENVVSQNLELNAENFVKHYDAPFSDIQRACLSMFEGASMEPSEGTTFCPYKEIWESLPMGREIAYIYCDAFHRKMWSSYHPLLRVRQDEIMTKGDDKCTFLTYMEGEEDNPVLIFDQK